MRKINRYLINMVLALIVFILSYLFLNYIFGLFVNEEKWGVNCGHFREYDNGVYDPYILYRPTPNLQGPECYTNNHGFRNKNNVSEIKNKKRVFILGGSTVWGIGVTSQNQTISNQMEILLNKYSNESWEVFNAAVSGYNTHQEFIQLYTKIMRLEPDYVVVIDGLNDLQYGSFDWWSSEVDHKKYDVLKNMFGKKTINGLIRDAIFIILNYPFNYYEGSNVILYLEMKQKENQIAGDTFKGNFNEVNENAAKNYIYYLSLMDDVTKSRNITTIFILQPILGFNKKRQYSDFENSLIEKFKKTGNWLDVLNSTYSLFQYEFEKFSDTTGYAYDFTDIFGNEQKQVYADAAHYTPYGNYLIGKKVVEKILGIEKKS